MRYLSKFTSNLILIEKVEKLLQLTLAAKLTSNLRKTEQEKN